MILRLVVLAAICCSTAAFNVNAAIHRTSATQMSHARLATSASIAPTRRVAAVTMDTLKAGPLKVGIVGVTGAVGKEIIEVLGTRKFDMSEIRLFASERSAGTKMDTPLGEQTIEAFTLEAAREVDVLFLAVSGDFALEWVPKITADGGPLVIDNSSAYRYDADVPLVVPEINVEVAKKSKKRLVANPNCTTAIALMALAPLHKEFGVKRCIMSTYQAASGAGAEGMAELAEGCKTISNGGEATNEVFAHVLPFNVIPHIDKFLDDDYTKEERKVTWETRKILDEPDMPVSCTCVRIPTLRAHAESITIETEKPIDIARVMSVLNDSPGVVVVDDIKNNVYPMPISATAKYDVEVGRIRKNDVFGENGLDFFIVGDQLLRGAALNAVIIAEKMIE